MTDDPNDRFPGYDVLSKRHTPSWNEITRQVINRRLAVPREPRYFTWDEFVTLEAICDRILPQPPHRPRVPLAAYVDARLIDGPGDGYRFAELPEAADAWRRGLTALDAESQQEHGVRFHLLSPHAQDHLLAQAQKGDLKNPAWGEMPVKMFFAHRLLPDIVHSYYAHPTAWSEIGFGGPASPRGYVRMKLDRRDPWEAAEAYPGKEERARWQNRHV